MVRCRGCGGELEGPLLSYPNMPSVAQHLPESADLSSDVGVTLRVCRCRRCGLVQLDNDPVPYFREVIRAVGISPEMRTFRMQQFGDWLKRYRLEGRRILEVGCGHGEYLELLSNAEAWGMEYGDEALTACKARGLRVRKGFPGEGEGPLFEEPFAGFLILNWLEHFPDPGTALDRIVASLVPEGVGLVEVPNFDFALRNKIFIDFTRDHLCYFTRQSLATLLELHGFDVLSCQVVWHNFIISAEVRRRQPLPIGDFEAVRLRLLAELDRFIGNRKVAVWGAGHQALMVLAAASLEHKICYVVDSAPFKQGKFTPATHLPIVPPNRLDEDPPEAIIVMAASFCNEVATTIRKRYGTRFRLALLRNDYLEVPNE